MSVSSVLLRNVTTLVAAQAAIKVLNFAVSIAMVRYLGTWELGRYSYIIAFAYPFGAIADFGLATLAIREISRDRDREAEVAAVLRRTMSLLAGMASFAMVGSAVLTQHDVATTVGLILVGMTNLLSAATTPALVVLTAREDLHLLSLYRVVASAIGAIAILIVLFCGGTSLALLMAGTGVNGVMLVLARVLVRLAPAQLSVRLSTVWNMMRQAIPFGLLMLSYALYYRVDMIMLNWLRDAHEVGLYAAAYRFLDAVILLAATLGGPFYPRLSSLAQRDPQGVRDLLESIWRPLLAVGLPLSLGTFFLAVPLTLTLFGEEFQSAGSILQILIWGSLPLFWINIPNHALNATDQVWPLAGVYGCSVLLNVVANLLLIPRWGAGGASIATVLCEWLNLVLVVRIVRRAFGVSFSYAGLWRYITATAGMATALWLLRGVGLGVEIPLAAVTYIGILLVLGYLRSSDMSTLRRLLAQ